MTRLTLIIFLLSSSSIIYSQQNTLAFKKGNKTISTFWKDDFIAFQLKDKQWQKGELTRIQNDSFYIRPRIVRYTLMNSDTFYYRILGFSISDVWAMPKKGLLIDYIDGRFQISRSAGHMHWYWIKSGWIFRAGAVGYAALDVTNGLIKENFTFKGSKLAIAAGVFLFGAILKRIYKPTLFLRRKYHLQMLKLSN